jgi:sulfonate transport system permease protein
MAFDVSLNDRSVTTQVPPVVDATIEIISRRRGVQRRSTPREVRRLYAPVGLLLLWAAASAAGLLNSRLFPAPWQVVQAGIRLTLNGELATHLSASLLRVVEGGVPGVLVGVFLAVTAGSIRVLEDSIDSLMQILKSIPEFTIVPLLIIWMGINDLPKITLIMLSVASPIYLNMYGAIRGVDQRLIESAKTLGLGYWARIWHIVLPGAMPGFFMGMRIAFTSAWLALVFAETINAQDGLGRLMSDARSWWQLDVMLLVITIYALLGLTSQLFLRQVSHRVLSWRAGYNGE